MRKVTELLQKLCFRLRHQTLGSRFRVLHNRLMGMKIGGGTCLCTGFHATWPHAVQIGRDCVVEPDVVFKLASKWSMECRVDIGDRVFIGTGCEMNISKHIRIGDRALIASGCRFVDHDHGFAEPGPIGPQKGEEGEIGIGADVWLGVNVVVLRGVHIGDGAVVGAGAVVTRSIPAGEIWAGIPAKRIGQRTAKAE